MADINSLAFRDEVTDHIPPDADLPAQGGGGTPNLPPGPYVFRIPANIAQLVTLFDDPKRGPDAKPIVGAGAGVEQRVKVHFDRTSALVVVGGPLDGEAMTSVITNIPFPRGKKGSDAPAVADMMYLLRVSRKYTGPLTRPREWFDALVAQANQLVRLKVGIAGRCDTERVRYLDDGNGGAVEAPDGSKGCGERYYTRDYKNPAGTGAPGSYGNEVACECGAIVRGFMRIEEFLPPLEG